MSLLARNRHLISRNVRLPVRAGASFGTTSRRCRELEADRSADYESKYADKLSRIAQERGKTVSELRAEMREQERERRRLAALAAEAARKEKEVVEDIQQTGETREAAASSTKPKGVPVRKDSSPVKPLDSILNLERLFSAPHTPDQISMLWKAYHTSRSGGTGRGFLSASIPLEKYEKMLSVAQRYPQFVVPLPRDSAQLDAERSEPERAYEFFLMEWGFHGAPADPSSSVELFAKPRKADAPQTSTVLFTPLQEYKLRQSFATPYLVLTHYPDLARSHGVVLLRGEITPSSGSSGAAADPERYMLAQQDAQMLAMAVQQFYLWSEGDCGRAGLLQTFHEDPENFRWEELLKQVNYTA